MSNDAILGQSTIALPLATRQLYLKPTLHAVRLLSRKYGGLQPLVTKLGQLDFDAIIDVIEAGIGSPGTNPRARMDLESEVYASGLSEIPVACIKYITVLINGGKPIVESESLADPNQPAA